ncbi:serine hydrolase domain-containing protein [Pseudonocardia sp.]|uniref:serine hydrolase domain-containing protein n=1 Tax=Pseudonocardia sp. TaxID=60912 RepID=UPI003D0F3022
MLMQGFPPPPSARVTLANWQEPPYNRWAFSHLREIVPTQRISRGRGDVMALPPALQPLGEVATARSDGTVSTVDAVLDATYTDGVVIVHDGRMVFERYGAETDRYTPHLLMSITKSVVGCVMANLVDRGVLSTDQLVTDHVPELSTSGYRGARVRHLLDMRSGIKFSELYTDPDAEVRVFEQAAMWRPTTHDIPQSTYAYLTTLVATRDHGGVFEYRSCETDVLGWVCERASGIRMADLIADLVWTPLGAELDAEITCDGLGAAMHDGGMNATTADLARFGVMLLADGVAGDHRVVPGDWLTASWNPDPDVRQAFADSVDGPYLPGGWYRNQFWFLPRAHGDVLLCLGINGQMLYVDPATGMVAAKTSSWPVPQSPTMLHDTLNAFDAAAAALAGHPVRFPHLRPGPPGVVAGLSRGHFKAN